jgi:hypothetical protein
MSILIKNLQVVRSSYSTYEDFNDTRTYLMLSCLVPYVSIIIIISFRVLLFFFSLSLSHTLALVFSTIIEDIMSILIRVPSNSGALHLDTHYFPLFRYQWQHYPFSFLHFYFCLYSYNWFLSRKSRIKSIMYVEIAIVIVR